jgi:hypothetical protein
LTKAIRDRMRRLLPMEYRPSEVAEALGVCADTVRRGWVRSGAPHRRDATGHIWICGTDLAAWLRSMQATTSVELQEGEAYCLHCQDAVTVEGPIEREVCGPAVLVRGVCACCGSGVARFEAVES